MSTIFGLLWIFSTIMFFIGIKNPEKALIPYAKKGKKEVFLVWFLSGLLFFILSVALMPNDETESNTTKIQQEITATEIVTAEPTQEPTAEPTEAPELQITVDLTEETLTMMSDNFRDIAAVTIDRELQIYNIIPTNQAFIDELGLVVLGDAETMDDWDTMVASCVDLSQTIYTNTGYSVALVNPANTENYLLLIFNGSVLYDFTDELE